MIIYILKGGNTMNFNEIHDYNAIASELKRYISQPQNINNQKVLKALHDAITLLDSASKLNAQENDMCKEIILSAIAASRIKK